MEPSSGLLWPERAAPGSRQGAGVGGGALRGGVLEGDPFPYLFLKWSPELCPSRGAESVSPRGLREGVGQGWTPASPGMRSPRTSGERGSFA